MQFIVVGPGYTGQRVVALLPAGRTVALDRATLDLDDPAPQSIEFPAPFSMLYTVPPVIDNNEDCRLVRLFDALTGAPHRFVYLSTTGVYGNCDGRIVDEDSPLNPSSGRARARVAAEQTATRLCAERATALFILRVPGIYGPGRLGLERIRNHAPIVAARGAAPGNRIHVDDLAACAVQALTTGAPPGIYNVGDGDHRSSTAFTMQVAALAGLAPPPEISLAEAEQTFSESRLSFLRESRIVDTRKMRDILGFTPRYTDPEDGIKASLKN